MSPRTFLTLPPLLLLLAGGCAPPLDVEVQSEQDLSALLDIADPEVVGFTIDPVSGARYLLDVEWGVFELGADGSAELRLRLEDFVFLDTAPRSVFTDIVALGGGRFAITAQSDGFLLDLETGEVRQHFCYVPSDMPEGPGLGIVDQLTMSLAYDSVRGELFAQPISFEDGRTDRPHASALFTYELEGGQPTGQYDAPSSDFLAGAAAFEAEGRYLLARDNALYRFDLEEWREVELLGSIPGVRDIQGMAVDPATGNLLVVDAAQDRLLEISVPLGEG